MHSGPSTSSWTAFLLLCVGTGVALADPLGEPRGSSQWRVFHSEQGRFRVALPAAPRFERAAHVTLMGTVREELLRADAGGWQVAVIYEDIPAAALWLVPSALLLSRAAASLVADEGGREVASRELTWRGRPAREIDYFLPASADLRARALLVFAETRLYLLLARWPEGDVMPSGVERFWRSFEITAP